jgi:hypothetical protein
LTTIGYEPTQNEYPALKYVNLDSNEYIKIYYKEDKLKAAILLGTKKGIPHVRKMLDGSLSENKEKLKELYPGIA